jgi:ParB family transcriptional regulator, chromosome partitioning protein
MVKNSKLKIRYKKPTDALVAMAAPAEISSVRASIWLDGGAGDLYQIKIDQLIPYKNQARKIFNQDEIAALAETIKDHGIRQPLTIIKSSTQEGRYEVVCGERRLRAASLLGFNKVPCIFLQDATKANEVALIENLHRSDLHPIEVAEAYQAFLSSGLCVNQQEIAEKVSVSKSMVSEVMKLNALPQEIKDYILSNQIKSRDVFRRLLSLASVDQMKSFLKINNCPVREGSMKSVSILRVTLSEGQYKIQKKAMNVLNAEQKKILKEKLLDVIRALS